MGDFIRETVSRIAFKVLRDLALDAASDLVSEEGENPEYDRALVEMTCRLLDLDTDEHRHTVAALIGVKAWSAQPKAGP